MMLSPAFRLLDLYQALCCLKNFRAPALYLYLNPDKWKQLFKLTT